MTRNLLSIRVETTIYLSDEESEAIMQELVNTVIAHYAIVKHLATGGMSNVYLAHDLVTEQEVALKLVPTSNEDFCQRFQREARTVSSLHHEHILPALDYGEFDCWCYLATPYIPGGTLRDLTQGEPLSLEKAGLYLDQIASALDYAHEQGIIHRDIKASNLLLREDDSVLLADFGLVKNVDTIAESLTDTGFMVGTAEYMAPELAEENATELSDIYALGIVVYQMLTGDVPFKGSTPIGTFMQQLSKQPLPPSQMNPNVPAAFDRVVLRALDKQPERRYQSALEFAQAYQQALALVMDSPVIETAKMDVVEQMPTMHLLPRKHKRAQYQLLTAIALVACLFLFLGVSTNMFHTTAHDIKGSTLNQFTVHSSLPFITGSSSTATPRAQSTPRANTPVPSTTGETSSIRSAGAHPTPIGISTGPSTNAPINAPANPPVSAPGSPAANAPASGPGHPVVNPPGNPHTNPPGGPAAPGNQNKGKGNGNGKAKGHDK
jgi:serine/threonine protein kinase